MSESNATPSSSPQSAAFNNALDQLNIARRDAKAAAVALALAIAPGALSIEWGIESECGDEGSYYSYASAPQVRLPNGVKVSLPMSGSSDDIEQAFDDHYDGDYFDTLSGEFPDQENMSLHLVAFARSLNIEAALLPDLLGVTEWTIHQYMHDGEFTLQATPDSPTNETMITAGESPQNDETTATESKT